MSEVTHQQAQLLLRLYDLRREPRLRQARQWFFQHFHCRTLAERAQLGAEDDASLRMVVSYWEMVAALVNRGLIDDELFFETTSEFWLVWERLKPLAEEVRQVYGNPLLWTHLQRLAECYEAWLERRAPGAVERLRELLTAAERTRLLEAP
jgi:hypothetical protein